MDPADEVENTEGARAYESRKERPENHEETKECQERSECRNRNRTEKGLEFDLEIGTKRREKALQL